MNNKPEFELLIDIAKLLKKYGPDTFESLAQNLSSPKFSELLGSILLAAAKATRKVQTKKAGTIETKRGSGSFRSSLIALEKKDHNKAELLVKFYDDLMSKAILPTLRDIQAFASDNGLPAVKATARDKAIVPFIKALLPLHFDELKSRLLKIRPVSSKDDRSLEGWSNIILDKERRIREGN